MRRIAAFLCLLAGCASYKKQLPSLPPPPAAPVAYKFSDHAREVRLSKIQFDVPMGYQYGEAAAGYGGCGMRKQPMVNTQGKSHLELAKFIDVFIDGMKKHGYPVEADVALFKDSDERVADLQVAARVVDAIINECYPHVDRNELEAEGTAYLKVEWSVFSALEKKVIFTVVTEGSTYGEVKSNIGEAGILRPALADAVERLSASEAYRKVIDPPAAPVVVASVARFTLGLVTPLAGEIKANIDKIKLAVVTVTANKGFGSGFVIAPDQILTAEHVVSGSKFVKVNTVGGKECYGQVVASSVPRDLALLQVDCAGLEVLPLDRDRMPEGSEVFAIGTPLSEKLNFTVTKGVISGMRKVDNLEYIQSDVSVLPGSSGGPLLDSHGNVVGVATLAATIRDVPVGLNFFIPIGDLPRYLPVDFK